MKYKVTLTQLVEQEATVYVDARDANEAADNALDMGEAGELVWHLNDTEPHSVSAERVESAETFLEAVRNIGTHSEGLRDLADNETDEQEYARLRQEEAEALNDEYDRREDA